MAKNKEPQTIWEYIDWLYLSHRLTAQEHLRLKELALNLEHTVSLELNMDCGNCDGCEQGFGCEYPTAGC